MNLVFTLSHLFTRSLRPTPHEAKSPLKPVPSIVEATAGTASQPAREVVEYSAPTPSNSADIAEGGGQRRFLAAGKLTSPRWNCM